MLSIDGLTAEELRALDAWHQACALNELVLELKRLGDIKRNASDLRYDAKMAQKAKPSVDNEIAILLQSKRYDAAAIDISTRKEQKSILQTLLNAAKVGLG